MKNLKFNNTYESGSLTFLFLQDESTHDLTVGVSSLDRTSSDSGKPATLQSGFYRDKIAKRFIAICLEFDLEAEAKSFVEVQEKIEDYTKLWLENVRENKLSEELLNKSAPEEYWDMANTLDEERKSRKRIAKNFTSVGMPISTSFFPYSKLLPF